MKIRRAEVSDSTSIGLVHVRSWQAAYKGLFPASFLDALDPAERGEAWGRYLAERPAHAEVFIAEADGTVVGFVSAGPSREEGPDGEGEVRAIYLLADFWGQGTGRRRWLPPVTVSAMRAFPKRYFGRCKLTNVLAAFTKPLAGRPMGQAS